MDFRSIILKTENFYVVSEPVNADSMNQTFVAPWQILKKRNTKEKTGLIASIRNFFKPAKIVAEEDPYGTCTFAGLPEKGRVFLAYENLKNISEDETVTILKLLCDWAFGEKDVYSLEIDLKYNSIAERVKSLLIYSSEVIDTKLVIHKETVTYTATSISVGCAIGLLLGGCFNIFLIGVLLGIIAGFFVGSMLDSREKVHRKALEGV